MYERLFHGTNFFHVRLFHGTNFFHVDTGIWVHNFSNCTDLVTHETCTRRMFALVRVIACLRISYL